MNTKKGNETKDHILTTCRELFYEHGYNATTTRMIAKSAGINLGLLNYYFKGKNEIGSIIYFDIRNNYNDMLESSELNLTPLDRFLYSSALELHLCLENHNFGTFYIDMINQQNIRSHIQSHIINKIKELGTIRDNPSFAELSAISLSAMKPALVRHALNSAVKLSPKDFILYYLEQQLAYFGKDPSLSHQYLETINSYHIDIAKNFTPILVKIK